MNRKKNFILLVMVGIGIMLILGRFIHSTPIVIGITYVVMICIYMGSSIYRRYKRISLLDDQCDPEAFLKKTMQQEALIGKNKKIETILKLDKVAAYLCLNEEDKALSLLLSIDKQKIKDPQLKIIYTVNLIIAYYELGDIGLAERLYEKEMGMLLPKNGRMKIALQILTGERYYFIGKYTECIDYFETVLKQPIFRKSIHKRQYIGIKYLMAQSNIELGNVEKAREQLKEVIANGNKLAIVNEVSQRLSQLEGGTNHESIHGQWQPQ